MRSSSGSAVTSAPHPHATATVLRRMWGQLKVTILRVVLCLSSPSRPRPLPRPLAYGAPRPRPRLRPVASEEVAIVDSGSSFPSAALRMSIAHWVKRKEALRPNLAKFNRTAAATRDTGTSKGSTSDASSRRPLPLPVELTLPCPPPRPPRPPRPPLDNRPADSTLVGGFDTVSSVLPFSAVAKDVIGLQSRSGTTRMPQWLTLKSY
mmetsp:Transcript_16896/g.52831  ORF Transcript_16896/g.52831 Transcript_16896/m.52831 type:complete len:207 (-) Transcript_16896:183-803(-)